MMAMRTGGRNIGYPISSTRIDATPQHQPGRIPLVTYSVGSGYCFLVSFVVANAVNTTLIVDWHSSESGGTPEGSITSHDIFCDTGDTLRPPP